MNIADFRVGSPDPDWSGVCPKCGYDAVLRFRCVVLRETGVEQCGHYDACVRCWDMAREAKP